MRKTTAKGIFLIITVFCYGALFSYQIAGIMEKQPLKYLIEMFFFAMFGSYFFGAAMSLYAFPEKEDPFSEHV